MTLLYLFSSRRRCLTAKKYHYLGRLVENFRTRKCKRRASLEVAHEPRVPQLFSLIEITCTRERHTDVFGRRACSRTMSDKRKKKKNELKNFTARGNAWSGLNNGKTWTFTVLLNIPPPPLPSPPSLFSRFAWHLIDGREEHMHLQAPIYIRGPTGRIQKH